MLLVNKTWITFADSDYWFRNLPSVCAYVSSVGNYLELLQKFDRHSQLQNKGYVFSHFNKHAVFAAACEFRVSGINQNNYRLLYVCKYLLCIRQQFAVSLLRRVALLLKLFCQELRRNCTNAHHESEPLWCDDASVPLEPLWCDDASVPREITEITYGNVRIGFSRKADHFLTTRSSRYRVGDEDKKKKIKMMSHTVDTLERHWLCYSV